MNQLDVRSDGRPAWGATTDIVLVQTDAAGYNRAVAHLASALADHGKGVFVSANRPTGILRGQLTDAGVDPGTFYFVDCVSAMTGVMPPSEDSVTYLESPTMLEKAALRAEQALRRTGARYVLLDSLSTLAVYNGPEAVAELVHTFVTRLRLRKAGAAFLIVDKQAPPSLAEAVHPLCDATVRL